MTTIYLKMNTFPKQNVEQKQITEHLQDDSIYVKFQGMQHAKNITYLICGHVHIILLLKHAWELLWFG